MSHASSGDRETVISRERTGQSDEEDDIRAIDILIPLAKHKKILVGLPLVAAGLAVVYSLLLSNIYTASAKILPPQQGQLSAAALVSQLGNAAALITALAGRKPISNELVVGVLKSRTVLNNLVQGFGLMKVYNVTLAADARNRLAADTKIASGKDGIITVDVEQRDPWLAADLTNGYVEELLKLTHLLVVTEASQRRQFFEKQLMQAKDNLAKAENTALEKLQQSGGDKIDEQERGRVEADARLLAEMALKELQIDAMRMFIGEDSPNWKLAEQQLEAMKRERAKAERRGGSPASIVASRGNGLEELALLRDIKYNQRLHELLAKEYAMAKADEAKDSPVMQVLDRAVVPEQKSKPKRALIVLLWSVTALFAALIWILVREWMARAAEDPQQAARWETLRRYLAWR